MSAAINGVTQHALPPFSARRSGESGNAAAAAGSVDGRGGAGYEIVDTVEISDEARGLSLKTGEEQSPPVNILNPAKRLQPGSEEHDAFKELMQKVKNQKSDVLSRIRSTLEKSGIKLSDLGKIKLEVDSGGKIVVGGVKDKKMAERIEKALNDEAGLASAVAEYRKNEKEFSRQVKDYTGATLYELGMAARGQVNSRIEEKGGYTGNMEAYTQLAFLGSANSFINVNDVRALSFDGDIDISGEISVMTDPESGIGDAMNSMFEKVTESFDKINGELIARLQAEAGPGGKIDQAKLEKMLLNADKAEITVDNRGKIKVEGELSKDAEVNRRGLEMIEKLVKTMLAESDTNSYGINLFSAGSEGLLARVREKGGSATRVAAHMQYGRVVKISADSEGSTGSALERRIQDMQRQGYSRVLG